MTDKIILISRSGFIVYGKNMLKKMLVATLFASVLGVDTFAYDAEKAKYFDAFYSKFTPKVLANPTIEASAEDVMILKGGTKAVAVGSGTVPIK